MIEIKKYDISNEFIAGIIKIIDTKKDIYLDLILKSKEKHDDKYRYDCNCNDRKIKKNNRISKQKLKLGINNKIVYSVDNFQTEICIKNIKLKSIKNNDIKNISNITIFINNNKVYEFNREEKKNRFIDNATKKLKEVVSSAKNKNVKVKSVTNAEILKNDNENSNEYKVLFIDEDIKSRKKYEEEIKKTVEKDLKKIIEYHNIDSILNDVKKQK